MPTQLTIASGIREFAISNPRRIAVIDGDRSITFAELDDRSSRFANILLREGFGVGDRVAILSWNRLEYIELCAGAAKAGVTLVPLNPRGSAMEHEALIRRSGTRGLVFDENLAGNVPPSADGLPLLLCLGEADVGLPYEAAIAGSEATDPMVEYSEDLPYCIQYTSGTTGQPKGAMLSHRARALTLIHCGVDFSLGPGKRTVAVAPMALGAGFSFGYAGPYLGGTTSMMRSWDPEALLATIERDRIHSVFLVPTHAVGLQRVMEGASREYDLSSLETLYFNAAALPVPLKEWVISAFPGVGIHELYGSTEGGIVTSLRPDEALRKAGSVGHPWFLTEVRLLDDDGNEVGTGERGELFSRSPYCMSGYLDDPESTADTIRPDGFLTAGDVAVKDEEGFIRIVDRKKDMIVSGAANIYPREIENVLYQLEEISEVAVVGLPDPTWGEQVAAFVVARPGASIDVGRLEAHLRGQLAGFKTPKVWEVIDEMPRNATGKIIKWALRDDYVSSHSEVGE
jgi:long-chain acyl-CoA synthetase